MDFAFVSAEESTALPTPASSECSSAFSHHQCATIAPQLSRTGPACSRSSKDMLQAQPRTVSEDVELSKKGPAHNSVRTSSSSRGMSRSSSSKIVEEASTRSRSNGKSRQPLTPAKGKSDQIGPPRSLSPSGERSPVFPRVSRTRASCVPPSVSALASQKLALEKELEESQSARAELEQKLEEESSRAMADRMQLARLASRIEQLESSREVNAALLEDSRFLRAELEAEKLQVEELTQQLELLKGEAPPPTVVLSSSQEGLLVENDKLRNELKQSQILLAKYTEELSMIMPDVELILTQWKADSVNGMSLGGNSSTRSGYASSATTTLPDSPGRHDPPAAPQQLIVVSNQQLCGDEGLSSSMGGQVPEEVACDKRRLISPVRTRSTASSLTKPQQRATSPAARSASGAAATRPRSVGRGGGGGGSSTATRSATSPHPPRPGQAPLRSSGTRQGKTRKVCLQASPLPQA